MTANFYLYIFLAITWLVYTFNSQYQGYKIKKFWPNNKTEILVIPFYIFMVVISYIIVQKIITDLSLENNTFAGFRPPWTAVIIIIGIIFCLFSMLLYTYISLFAKSFPSCMAMKDKRPLEGIYKYIRHPSYHIIFYATFGSALCLLNLPLFIFACANHIFLYFHYILEEDQVRKTSPYYNDYLKRTNRFLPNFIKIPTKQN